MGHGIGMPRSQPLGSGSPGAFGEGDTAGGEVGARHLADDEADRLLGSHLGGASVRWASEPTHRRVWLT